MCDHKIEDLRRSSTWLAVQAGSIDRQELEDEFPVVHRRKQIRIERYVANPRGFPSGRIECRSRQRGRDFGRCSNWAC